MQRVRSKLSGFILVIVRPLGKLSQPGVEHVGGSTTKRRIRQSPDALPAFQAGIAQATAMLWTAFQVLDALDDVIDLFRYFALPRRQIKLEENGWQTPRVQPCVSPVTNRTGESHGPFSPLFAVHRLADWVLPF
jgi:hypothetical protein